MKCLAFVVLLLITYSSFSKTRPDYRPKFDKSAYKRTVWTQVNPWWIPSKIRRDDRGGANYAQKIYPDGKIARWEEAIKECGKYGVTGWQFELVTGTPILVNAMKAALAGAKRAGSTVKLGIFLTITGSRKAQDITKDTISQLKMLEKELKEHPNIYRLDGAPLISIYKPGLLKPEEWGNVIKAIEKECGKFIWLFNSWSGEAVLKPKKAPAYIRKYLPYFDGISQYANWSDKSQKEMFELVAPIMHNEFPQKIFEAAIHNAYAVHFHYGGVDTKLSEKYRHSWVTVLAAKPDSIVLTNMFDHYENSLILPCYERENFMLRYAQYQLAQWRGENFPEWDRPELVLTNYISILIGRQMLEYEIVAFPLKSNDPNISVTVELADCSGKVIHKFPFKKLKLDKLNCVRFSIPSEKFAKLRAVVPRIVYRRFGRENKTRFNPPTVLNPSMRSNLMFWANSTRNALNVNAKSLSWTLNSLGVGSTVDYPECGVGVVGANIKPVYGKGLNRGIKVFRIMRNGIEHYIHRSALSGYRAIMLAEPTGALNYYHLEMENENGSRVRTLPIWVTRNRRRGNIKVPIRLKYGKIINIEIEKARVPYFYYPIKFNAGNLLIDASGYMHNGRISAKGYGGGHLGCTGYYHYHNGPVKADDGLFVKDENGLGMLRMDGNSYVMIMGGTAFPGASTYEIWLRPRKFGKRQGIFGTANNQVNLAIEPDGKVKAWRGSETEGEAASKPKRRFSKEVISQTKLNLDKWVHIAVVYNLKKLKLYINGKFEGSVAIPPSVGHDWINHLTVGSLCDWLWKPKDKFIGDIRAIRFYGRNLSPVEFLK